MPGLLLTPRLSASCPRCSYDLRTAVASWTDACPLDGRCTECGLDFQWGELFNPGSRPPRWNIEYCPPRRWPFAFVCTMAATVASWPLWARLRMEIAWRPRRVAAYIASLLLLFVLVPWLGNTALALRFWWQHREGLGFRIIAYDRNLPARTHPPSTLRGPQLATVLVEALVLPMASKSSATVIVDGYELPCPSPRHRTCSLWRPVQLDATTGGIGARWRPHGPRGWLIRCKGTQRAVMADLGDPNAPLSSVPTLTGLPGRLFDPNIARCAFPLLVQAAGMVAIFALLPTTRRRCKVRGQHLARIATYSVALLIITFVAALPAREYLEALGTLDTRSAIRLSRILPLVMPLILAAWWAIAIHRYLRMPHAVPIAGLAALAGWMLSALLFMDIALTPLFLSW